MDADSSILLAASCDKSKTSPCFSMYCGMTRQDSAPTSQSIGDTTSSLSSDNDDANKDNDVSCVSSESADVVTDRKRDSGEDQEGSCLFTTDEINGDMQDPHTLSPPQSSGFDVIDRDAVVRVRRIGTCEEGSKFKDAVVTPVADLVKDSLDLKQTQVEAVPVTHHFYNRWARLPRVEDPDRDVTSTTRRPVLTATGSLKSYTLMSAIMRDKQSSIQNLAALFQLPNASTSPEAATSDRNGLSFGRSLSDTFLMKTGLMKSVGSGTHTDGLSQTFPPIMDKRTETAPGTARSDAFSNPFPCTSTERDSYSTTHSPIFSERLFDGDGKEKRRDVSCHQSGKWPCSSLAGSYSAPLLRCQQALPINTASLLFSNTIDMRDERYRLLLQKQPRGLFFKARPQTETEGGRERNRGKLHKHDSGANDKPAEVTCVEFIDLMEVQTSLHRVKGSEIDKKTDGTEKRPTTDLRSAKGRLRMIGSMGQRIPGPKPSDNLNDRHFLTVGTPLPLHASED